MHASCVAWDGRAALIIGASGSGKSSLALALMAFGAELVSDDRTQVMEDQNGLWASAPASISGMIEARGIGILNAVACPRAQVSFVVDMDKTENARFPEPKRTRILGQDIAALHNVDSPAFAAAILQYLKSDIRGTS